MRRQNIGLKGFLEGFPNGMLSAITLIAILWLTLAPKPLGDETPDLFPGADKVVHGIMFGFLTAMFLLDWQRRHDWLPVKRQRAFFSGIVSAVIGVLIEFAQLLMGLGRGFEYSDIAADTIGAGVVAIAWLPAQRLWSASGGR